MDKGWGQDKRKNTGSVETGLASSAWDLALVLRPLHLYHEAPFALLGMTVGKSSRPELLFNLYKFSVARIILDVIFFLTERALKEQLDPF